MRWAMPYCTSWLRSVPVIPPGSCWSMTATEYSRGAPTGWPSALATRAKCVLMASSGPVSMSGSWPRLRRLSAVFAADGIDGPFAIDSTAVCTIRIPASTPMRWFTGASPVVLWKCISRGTSPAAVTMAGRKSTARSTASTPASSPISNEVTPSTAASFATLSAK